MRPAPFRPEIKQNLLPPPHLGSEHLASPTEERVFFSIGFTRGFGYLDELVNDYPFDLAATLGAEPAP